MFGNPGFEFYLTLLDGGSNVLCQSARAFELVDAVLERGVLGALLQHRLLKGGSLLYQIAVLTLESGQPVLERGVFLVEAAHFKLELRSLLLEPSCGSHLFFELSDAAGRFLTVPDQRFALELKLRNHVRQLGDGV